MRRIAVVCTARPSYAKLQPVIRALVVAGHRPVLYITSGALLYRFGAIIDQVRVDFPTCEIVPIYAEFDGYTLTTSAKSTAALLGSLADAWAWERPGLVLVNHDRREVLAAAQAAAYQNIPVAHLGGGERSGNIDDRVRDAITCLSTYHFPATQLARERVDTLVDQAHAWCYGCPSVDQAREALLSPPVTLSELGGAGPSVDLSRPFLLVLQHPCTEEPEEAFRQMMTTLHAVRSTKLPAVVLWPGTDAGAEGASKAIRLHAADFHTVRTLPPQRFLRLMQQATVLVGNSSAGIRESAYLGTPVVNVGERQHNREHGANVRTVPHDHYAILVAIGRQMQETYPSDWLYGDGTASVQIAGKLLSVL